MNVVTVELGERSYQIQIGSGLLQLLGTKVHEIVPASQYFFVLDEKIESTHGLVAMQSCNGTVDACTIQAVESNKTIQTVQEIWSAMLACGFHRHTPLISIGGGLTGDVAGFAASTFMRGVPVIQVPTTLLAMVDASIGGKTGVNLPINLSEGQTSLGKNLAGTFWQPHLVVVDVDVLQTLDNRQMRCGLAECVKHAMLGHEDLLVWIEHNIDAIFAKDIHALIELVTTCAAMKAEIVQKDERESGIRALLNLGHTFAHAIEPIPELSLYHGEAVSIGLCAAVSCAEASRLICAERADRIRSIISTIGLPTRLPIPIEVNELLIRMQTDKKNVDASIRLVLPTDDGAILVDDVDNGAIGLAWASVGAELH